MLLRPRPVRLSLYRVSDVAPSTTSTLGRPRNGNTARTHTKTLVAPRAVPYGFTALGRRDFVRP
eukprot:6353930-Prymnesium_polylepis.1